MAVDGNQLGYLLSGMARMVIGLKKGQNDYSDAQVTMEETLTTGLWTDLSAINAMAQSVLNLRNTNTLAVRVANDTADLFSRLNALATQQGLGSTVLNLDTWLQYFNTGAGGPLACLCHPAVRFAMESVNLQASRENFFFPVNFLDGHIGSINGAAYSAGTITVDQAKYVGGQGWARMATFAASQGAITVTGTAWDPATKTFLTGRTWVSTGGNFTAVNTLRQLIPGGPTPAPAQSLLVATSGISAVTAGNRIDVYLRDPAARIDETWI